MIHAMHVAGFHAFLGAGEAPLTKAEVVMEKSWQLPLDPMSLISVRVSRAELALSPETRIPGSDSGSAGCCRCHLVDPLSIEFVTMLSLGCEDQVHRATPERTRPLLEGVHRILPVPCGTVGP